MNILVTGGAGYIGSVTTAQLIESGHTVVVYDNLSRGHQEAIHPQATLVEGDLENLNLLKTTLRTHKIEAVMHFAAFIEAGESMKNPEVYFHNNTKNTLGLLESMVETGIKTFVFSSTAAVYGNPTEIPITENSPLYPTNAYGASKLAIENVLHGYYIAGKINYAALRYFNASGATAKLGEDHQPESHLIPLAMQAALGQRPPLKLFGTNYPTRDGTCVRDYIHVSDLARAHLLALNALEQGEGQLIFNLGSEKGFTNFEVIETIGKVLDKKVPFEKAPRRPGDPDTLIASSKKIREQLGWKPEYTDIEAIIKTSYQWRASHPDGYGGSKERG